MVNRQLSFSDNMREYLIASGAVIENEGAVLVSVLEDNTEKVKVSAGEENEKVVGFAWSNAIIPGTVVATKTETVDKDYEAGTFTIALANAVDGSVRAVLTKASDGTSATAAGTLTDGVYTITGAVEEGDVIAVTYRKNLTVAESQAMFGDKRPNLNNNLALGSISVIRGNGDMVTDQFDTSADWSAATEAAAGANGLLVPAAAGKTTVGRITMKPSAGNQWLRVSFNLA